MKGTVQPLKGRIALVTGASSGIGEAVTRRLAAGGGRGGGGQLLRQIKPQERYERYEQIKLAGGSNDARCAPLSPTYWR